MWMASRKWRSFDGKGTVQMLRITVKLFKLTFADIINDKAFIEIIAGVWSDNDGEDFVVSIAGHFWY